MIIVESTYVDLLAGDVVTLGLEIEQTNAALAQEVNRSKVTLMGQLITNHPDDPVIKRVCEQLAGYIEKRNAIAERILAIAAQFGAPCRNEDGARVLVGLQWVIKAHDGNLTLFHCIAPEPSPEQQTEQQTEPKKLKITAGDQIFMRLVHISF